MSIFMIKSILSIVLVFLSIVALFTMFEISGRTERKYNIEKLKKAHKINGKLYFLLYVIISYFCINFIINTKSELNPRTTFHAVFTFSIIIMFLLKMSYLKIYRQFYNQAKILGLLIVIFTFLSFGTSGGYFLLKQIGLNKDTKSFPSKSRGDFDLHKNIILKCDAESIKKGKELFETKCIFCHEYNNKKILVGPGLKGILKNELLPVSRKKADPETITEQLFKPYKDMPSFSYLKKDDIENIIAFLNTL